MPEVVYYRKRRFRIISITTVFVNKTLFSSKLNAPIFITWTQCVLSAIICVSMMICNQLFPNAKILPTIAPFDVRISRKVFPLSVMFSSTIVLNNLCLKHVSVAFYYISRSLTTVFNVYLTYVILKEKTSRKCLLCCGIIIIGYILGVDQENLIGSLSIIGTVYGVLGSFALSLYSVKTKEVLPVLNNEIWSLSLYNNVNSCVLLVPFIFFNGEISELYKVEELLSAKYMSMLLVGGIFGFLIGFFTSLQIKVTSPLTHNVSGTAKACFQTVLASYWYQEAKPALWWLSNAIVLLGSAGYARVKQLDMVKSYERVAVSQKV